MMCDLKPLYLLLTMEIRAIVIWLDCTNVTVFFLFLFPPPLSCYWTTRGVFFAKPILSSCAVKTAESLRLHIDRTAANMCVRKAIEPHSSSRLAICRIFGLLARICVVDDMFTACHDVPKSCALVHLQHTASRHVEYTRNLSSTEAIRTIRPSLMRSCAILILRH